MTREQIIEAMARALWEKDCDIEWEKAPEFYKSDYKGIMADAQAALTALETAIPGLADVIAGKAYFAPRGIADGTMQVLLEKEFPGFAGLLAGTHVIVPVDPTERMIEAALETAIPGLADVIRGTAVVVNKPATGEGDWFWHQMDPDEAGDSIHEALRFVPDFVVCHIGASYVAPSFFAARVPKIDDDGDTEELIAETEDECIRLVTERRAMIEARPK